MLWAVCTESTEHSFLPGYLQLATSAEMAHQGQLNLPPCSATHSNLLLDSDV